MTDGIEGGVYPCTAVVPEIVRRSGMPEQIGAGKVGPLLRVHDDRIEITATAYHPCHILFERHELELEIDANRLQLALEHKRHPLQRRFRQQALQRLPAGSRERARTVLELRQIGAVGPMARPHRPGGGRAVSS